jgi:aminobenzoyl-glutamate utilization protein B
MKHRRLVLLCCLSLSAWSLSLASAPVTISPNLADDREEVLRKMDAQTPHFGDLSRRIWELAEVGYKEVNSSELLKAELRAAGFQIQDHVAAIPTAFTASWGQGRPVIGILGEYDALPGLSQEAVPEKKPRVAGAPGHGCGHNLFGAASAFAAIAVKDYLAEKKIPGTIRFYGTPAEEGGGGKIYMARAGAFNDCDVVLAWHPGSSNGASLRSSLANISAKFRFYGKAAHAAGAPDKGRSSLDAVMLMAHAVDMLREHVPEVTRIHYIVTQGGAAPNVVPDFAEAFYYARHPEMSTLDGIWARIVKCAEAAALATETRMEMELINSVYNLLPNDALAALFDRNLRRVGGVKYSPEMFIRIAHHLG